MSEPTRKSSRIRFSSAKLHSFITDSASTCGANSSVSKPRRAARVTTSRYFEETLTIKHEHEDEDVKPVLLPEIKQPMTRKRKQVSDTVVKVERLEDKDEDIKPLLIKPTKKVKTEVDRLPAKCAPPEKYAHLQYLTDYLVEGLDAVFCGINPGCRSAEVGHHFAHPTNHFWRCLHQSGFTERQLDPSEDVSLPGTYNLGMTDLVERPSSEQAELSKADMLAGVPVLLAKIQRYKPRVVCFVGKQIGELFCKEATKLTDSEGGSTSMLQGPSDAHKGSATSISNQKRCTQSKGKEKKTFQWGVQPFRVVHSQRNNTQSDVPADKQRTIKETLLFVMPSTSARVAGYQLADKVRIMKDLFECVQRLKPETDDLAKVPSLGDSEVEEVKSTLTLIAETWREEDLPVKIESAF